LEQNFLFFLSLVKTMSGTKDCADCHRQHRVRNINHEKISQNKISFTKKSAKGSKFPTDTLNSKEQSDCVKTILKTITLSDADRIDRVVLKEPPKNEVKAFINGVGPLPAREATVNVWKDDLYTQYTIDVNKDEIIGEEIIPYARPAWTCRDEFKVIDLAFANSEFRVALKKRQIYSAKSPGGKRNITEDDINKGNIYLDVAVDGRRTLVKEDCPAEFWNPLSAKEARRFYFSAYWNSGNKDTISSYIQPISGIYGVVDLKTNEVVIKDTGVTDIPVVTTELNWSRKAAYTLNNLSVNYKNSYTLNGTLIEWGPWKMRWGWDPTFGLELRHIQVLDPTAKSGEVVWRNIAYKLSLSEFLTIYGSPDITGTVKNFYDLSEYPARDYVPPLISDVDVPKNATMLTAAATFDDGSVFNLSNVAAIHEADADCAFRHVDYPCDGKIMKHGARNRELVLTTAHTIANYDYIIHYRFDLLGNINMVVDATGLMETSGIDENTFGEQDHGTVVRQAIIAPNHYHIFTFRIDFDLDNAPNKVAVSEITPDPISCDNPYGNTFKESHTKHFHTEHNNFEDEYTQHDFTKMRSWLIESSNKIEELDLKRSYLLTPFPVSSNLLDANARISQRSITTRKNMLVTAYNDKEQYSSGEFPVESDTDEGLGLYIAKGRMLHDKDVVCWYTTGFGHSPHSEEYPVMPRQRLQVRLSPHNFFRECPGLYIPGASTQGRFPNTD